MYICEMGERMDQGHSLYPFAYCVYPNDMCCGREGEKKRKKKEKACVDDSLLQNI